MVGLEVRATLKFVPRDSPAVYDAVLTAMAEGKGEVITPIRPTRVNGRLAFFARVCARRVAPNVVEVYDEPLVEAEST